MLQGALHFALSPAMLTARRLRSLLTDRAVRELAWTQSRLRGVERYQERPIRIGRHDLLVPDVYSFLYTYQEIFVDEIYRFTSKSDVPSILDVGANIGLSALYFKSLYPTAEITAIEADPRIFAYLQRNLETNGASDVRLYNVAAWDAADELWFHSEGADAGRVSVDAEGLRVPSVNLADMLSGQRFDLIKIDIEGAETRVVPAIRGLLRTADFVFVEYHSLHSEPQALDKVIATLADTGFRLRIDAVTRQRHPLIATDKPAGFDAQMNIFGRRA